MHPLRRQRNVEAGFPNEAGPFSSLRRRREFVLLANNYRLSTFI
jgi:hypothetical protein